MMFLIRFWWKLTNKDSVENAKYEIEKNYLFLKFLDVFFHGSGYGFSGSDQDFKLIRIQTKKKSLIRIQIRKQKSGSETLVLSPLPPA